MLSGTQNELRMRWLAGMKEGTRVKERLTKEGQCKSLNQVKAHFGLVIMMIRQTMIDYGWAICGVAPNKNMIHDILKKACGGVGECGENLGLSEMTIEQAAKFFENCRDWAASELKIVIPDPNPNWKEQA